jgi:hypothetical protein
MSLPIPNALAAIVVSFVLIAAPASPASPIFPMTVGECVETSIETLTSRLDGMPDSGDAIVYANGLYGVSYDRVEGLKGARAGDPVRLCLTFVPDDCPPGDSRGRRYKATDLRTHREWELPDAQHLCGGA